MFMTSLCLMYLMRYYAVAMFRRSVRNFQVQCVAWRIVYHTMPYSFMNMMGVHGGC